MRLPRKFQTCLFIYFFYEQILNVQNSKRTISTPLEDFVRAKEALLCCFLFAYFCLLVGFWLFFVFVSLTFVRKKIMKRFENVLVASITHTAEPSQLKTLLVIFVDLEQSKISFGETPWLIACHATPLVTLLFGITILLTGRHCMPVVIYHECHGFERTIFTLMIFYLALLPAGFKASLGAFSSTSRLTGLRADLWNIAPVRLFVWTTTIHKRVMLVGSI